MAFVRKKTKVYSWPVEISKPSETKVGEFDKTTFNADEAVKFLSEPIEGDISGLGRPQNYIYNQHPNMYLPVGRNAEDYESNPFQRIKSVFLH